MRPRSTAELIFEAPPRLSWPVERRLSGRAIALWEASCRDSEPPAAADFLQSELASFCAASSVGLVATADGVTASSVGDLVAAAFGLARGELTDTRPTLGAEISGAFTQLCRERVPVSFEASLTGSERVVVMLTRGVVLPLLDADGALTLALAILTWKEVLGGVASDGLCDELGSAIAAGRAECRVPGSLHAAFGKPPRIDRSDAFDRGGLEHGQRGS